MAAFHRTFRVLTLLLTFNTEIGHLGKGVVNYFSLSLRFPSLPKHFVPYVLFVAEAFSCALLWPALRVVIGKHIIVRP